MLLGKVVSIDEVLVKYRTHRNNIWELSEWLTIQERAERIVYFLNDRLRICADVVRCINQHKRTINDPSHFFEFDKYIDNINVSSRKLALTLKILTGCRIIRLYSLLKYMCMYGLPQEDISPFIWAISNTAYRIGRSMRNMLRARSKPGPAC
jgi:hypothetical protein